MKFDPAQVNEQVRADITAILQADPRLANFWRNIYPESVLSVEEGRNLAQMTKALQTAGLPLSEAGELALYVHNRATAIMDRARQLKLGLTEAEWRYAAACHPYGRPTLEQVQQDKAHQAADGKRFLVAEGMLIEGRRTWPGMDRHCKCGSKVVVEGLS